MYILFYFIFFNCKLGWLEIKKKKKKKKKKLNFSFYLELLPRTSPNILSGIRALFVSTHEPSEYATK
ncbi:hypothetical protein HanOQP8_Chr09g0338191 [Helianthus annuus]|nr:hypothetical protein HanOQP8_Chr09g0338191 [Helianthus annuus]